MATDKYGLEDVGQDPNQSAPQPNSHDYSNLPGLEDFPDEYERDFVPAGAVPPQAKFDYDPADGGFHFKELQHPDLSYWDRFKLKNFSANPRAMRGWLGNLGYEVKDIPGREGEYNFAIRKGKSEDWYVVDPEGSEWSDISDLIADGTIAIGSAAAGVTTILGAAGVAAGGELAREGIGALMGAPGNFDAGNVALQGVGGAAFPAVGRGAIALGEKFGSSILMKAGSKIAGIRGTAGLPGEQVLGERAAMRAKALRNPVDAAYELLDTVRTTGRSRIPAWSRARAIERSVQESGQTVDARATRDLLQEYAAAGQGIVRGAGYEELGEVRGIRNQIAGLLEDAMTGAATPEAREEAVNVAIRDSARLVAGAPNSAQAFEILGGVFDNYLELAHGVTDWAHMPVTVAAELKSLIDGYARAGKAYSGQGETVATAVGILSKRLKSTLGKQINQTMSNSPLYDQWVAERAGVARGMRTLTGWRKRLFSSGNEDEFHSVGRAAGVINELYGNKPWQIKNMIAKWKEISGVNLETPLMREAGITSAMTGGEVAAGQLTPRVRFTAVGTQFGVGALAGWTATGGNPMGAVAGAVAAPFVFSPGGMVLATRATRAAFRPAMLGGQAASQAAYHAAAANRTRQVLEPPRRTVLNR